jgi:dehydrogenase/reductase SDR family member 7B
MKDKVVIITGSSTGIGKALAEVFAKHGSKVVISARHEDKLNETKNELLKMNANVLSVAADVSKEEDCRRLINEAVSKFGTVDVLICNAGISMRALFEELDLSVIKQLMDVNFWGTVYCIKHALPYLLKSQGSIVGISSIAGKKGLPARTGYSASKFAMEGFLETLRTENLNRGLHVLITSPGFTATNIRAQALSKDNSAQGASPRNEKKMMSAEEVAQRIYKAIVKRKRDLVLTSQGKLTVWLDKFFPAFMDRMVFNHMAKEKDSPLKKQ